MKLEEYLGLLKKGKTELLDGFLGSFYEPVIIGEEFERTTDYLFSNKYKIAEDRHELSKIFLRSPKSWLLQTKNKFLDVLIEKYEAENDSYDKTYRFRIDCNFSRDKFTSISFIRKIDYIKKNSSIYVKDKLAYQDIKQTILDIGEFALSEHSPLWIIVSGRRVYFQTDC